MASKASSTQVKMLLYKSRHRSSALNAVRVQKAVSETYIGGIVLGRKGSAFAARLALFWSLLASSPLMLLNGLVGGFIGKGPALQMVGLIWLGVFMWFWLSCLSCTEGEQEP